jgi:uncharacterized protein YggE
VRALREVDTSSRSALRPQAYELDARTAAALDKVALPVRAGKDDLSVTVKVVWEFA